MIVLILVVLLFGGLVEIVPLFFQKSTTEPVKGLKPIHSAAAGWTRHLHPRRLLQLPFADDSPFPCRNLRYGHYSVAGEFVYDHPFQWGSKRTGPDLAPCGWQVQRRMAPHHLINPRDVVPESNMPAYPWLLKNEVDAASIPAHMRALRKVGVPYTDDEIAKSTEEIKGKMEIDAVIAYLQVLGTAIKQ
jgi:cytochrome c oxidase cbb3-type subunit 2